MALEPKGLQPSLGRGSGSLGAGGGRGRVWVLSAILFWQEGECSPLHELCDASEAASIMHGLQVVGVVLDCCANL